MAEMEGEVYSLCYGGWQLLAVRRPPENMGGGLLSCLVCGCVDRFLPRFGGLVLIGNITSLLEQWLLHRSGLCISSQ